MENKRTNLKGFTKLDVDTLEKINAAGESCHLQFEIDLRKKDPKQKNVAAEKDLLLIVIIK